MSILRGRLQRLEQELQEMRAVLEVVNHLGPQLCQRSPGEGAGVVESMVSRANRRFDAICEQIQRRAERLELSRQRSLEVTGDLEDLLDWFREVERQLADAQPIVAEPDVLAAMLREQKVRFLPSLRQLPSRASACQTFEDSSTWGRQSERGQGRKGVVAAARPK